MVTRHVVVPKCMQFHVMDSVPVGMPLYLLFTFGFSKSIITKFVVVTFSHHPLAQLLIHQVDVHVPYETMQ